MIANSQRIFWRCFLGGAMKKGAALLATILFLSISLAAPALINPAFVSPAWAGHSKDYDEGEAAYNKGDYATALRKFRPLAEQGDAEAQFNLGWMYTQGWGVPRDDTEAAKWWHKAAEQGNANAQGKLGFLYTQGRGVPRDDTEAVKWYRKAAEQGNNEAAHWLKKYGK